MKNRIVRVARTHSRQPSFFDPHLAGHCNISAAKETNARQRRHWDVLWGATKRLGGHVGKSGRIEAYGTEPHCIDKPKAMFPLLLSAQTVLALSGFLRYNLAQVWRSR
jgi:hypothetical protein